MERKYSEKELLIFKGFKKIIMNNDIENIKVSDIAKAAEIGKGTIYEYFKSKDEIIAKSIIYIFKVEIKNTIESIKNISTFKEQCYELFNYSINSRKFLFPSLRILYNHVIPTKLSNILLEDCNEILELQSEFYKLIDYIIDTGIHENIINKNLDIDYKRYVLMSSSMGIINNSNICDYKNINLASSKTFDTQINFAYTMILKSLT